MIKDVIYCFLLFWVLFFLPLLVNGQISNVEYGKNRIQFHDDFETWYRYETDHFITHWYGKSRTISDFVIKIAEHDFVDLERTLEHHINDKIDILVYTDLTDLKQSNIGLEEAFVNKNFRTKVDGRKLFVYFDGSHIDLRQQVREGITEVYLNDMIFGGNLQQIVQNAVSSDLPAWYRDGFVSYMGSTWDADLETELFDLLQLKRPKTFEDIERIDHVMAGHILWHYVASQYGRQAISNILYVTRLNRDIDENFIYILGESFEKIKKEAFDSFKKKVLSDKGTEKLKSLSGDLEIKNKKKARITSVKSDNTKNNIAYVFNELGKTKIYIEDLASGTRKKIFQNSYRNIIQATDFNYPLITWDDKGDYLFIVYENRDVIYLRRVDADDLSYIEEPLSPEYGRIFSLDYIDEKSLLFSGEVEGQIDLFIYYPANRNSRQLTKDIYDNVEATHVQLNNEYGILFSSNRPVGNEDPLDLALNKKLPVGNFSIFLKSLSDGVIYPLTNDIEGASHSQPLLIDSAEVAYLTDESGSINRKYIQLKKVFVGNKRIVTFKSGVKKTIAADTVLLKIHKDSIESIDYDPVYKYVGVSSFNTDYVRPFLFHTYSQSEDRFVDVIQFNGVDRIKYSQNSASVTLPEPRWYTTQASASADLNDADIKKMDDVDTISATIPPEYLFQSEFPDPVTASPEGVYKKIAVAAPFEDVAHESDRPLEKINFSRILGSRLTFHVADVDFNFDNELLFDGLQNFASSDNGEIINQPFGILLKMKLRDQLEDYRFEAGVRFPTDFRGSEYFIVFDDNKKRIDKRYAFYRRANTELLSINQFNNELKSKRISHIALTRWKYPLDVYRSLRATLTFRADNDFLLISETNTLASEENPTQRFGLKLEYVFDNSLQWDYNIIHGTRYKFFGEVINRSVISLFDDWEFKPHEGFMTILGMDARHYQRLDNRSVLALRLAGATSFGSEKVLYYLGGVDNWLFPNRNEVIPISPNQNFVYQGLGVQMRGFDQNIRNGQSYAVFNSELRIPVFQYFKKDRLRSSFLRNILITGFFDVGTAWVGTSPFGEDNPLNIITVSNARSTVRVNFFRDALVYGFGGGIRSYMFGYNLRLDYGWGVDSGVRQDGILYFSIGKDF